MTRAVLAPALLAPALLAGCYQPAADPCAGGGDVSLAIGAGEHDDWTAYEDGDTAPMVLTDDAYGFEISLLAAGLDTRTDVTFVGQVAAGGEDPRGIVASGELNCLGDGTGWMRVWVALSSIDQVEWRALGMAGEELFLDLTVEDGPGTQANAVRSLVIDVSALP